MPKATPESPRMFANDFVDYFSRTHFSVVAFLYVPAAAILLWYSNARAGVSAMATVALAFAGFLVWTLTEYWLHRTLFHWEPKGAWGERMHFLVHGVHHTWPRDKYRLVMPPAVSITLFAIFLSLFLLVLGFTYAWAFHAGFVVGYMYYDLTHYFVHHGRPRTKYMRRLRSHHMVHHFKTPTKRFGVSSKFWDYIFRTEGESGFDGNADARADEPTHEQQASEPSSRAETSLHAGAGHGSGGAAPSARVLS